MEDIRKQIEDFFSQGNNARSGSFQKAKEAILSGNVTDGLKSLIPVPDGLKTAINLLQILSNDTSFENQASSLKADFRRLNLQESLMDRRDYKIEFNQIINQLNTILDVMDEDGFFDFLKNDAAENSSPDSNTSNANSSEILDVFISYSTKDQEAKNELVGVFQREGITFFLDEKSLEIGKDIDDSLENALDNTRFTVFLVSENSLKSIWVSKETIYRLLNEQASGEVSILPVLLDNKAFDEEFVFEIHDIMTAELEKQKNLRQKAAERSMDTSKYDERIERLEFVIPQLNTIFTKLTEGLSANFFDESRKEADLKKLIDTIKGRR